MYKELIKLASDCGHMSERVSVHRFALINATKLIAKSGLKSLNAVTVGRYGLRVNGLVVDVHAALEAVLWEDEHCETCCVAFASVVKVNGTGLRLICAPTKLERSKAERASGGSITDEYWTD